MIIELAAYRAARASRMPATNAHDELSCMSGSNGAIHTPAPQPRTASVLVTDDLPHAELAAMCRDAYGLATQI
jgi:hypothetical protein